LGLGPTPTPNPTPTPRYKLKKEYLIKKQKYLIYVNIKNKSQIPSTLSFI